MRASIQTYMSRSLIFRNMLAIPMLFLVVAELSLKLIHAPIYTGIRVAVVMVGDEHALIIGTTIISTRALSFLQSKITSISLILS